MFDTCRDTQGFTNSTIISALVLPDTNTLLVDAAQASPSHEYRVTRRGDARALHRC